MMAILACLLILCSLSTVIVDSSELQNVTVKEGEDAILPCALPPRVEPKYLITWFMGNAKYLTKRMMPTSTTKYIDRAMEIDSQDALVLRKTVREDTGTYSCKVLYYGPSMQTAAAQIMLFVKGPPVITSSLQKQYVLVQSIKSPKDLIINCRATGYPTPQIIWTRYNGKLSADRTRKMPNGTLVISKATRGDGGAYSCLVTNELGRDLKNFTVSVLEPPKILGKTEFHFNVGETAKLFCKSRGNPPPAVTWSWKDIDNKTVILKDGEDDSRRRVAITDTDDFVVSTLTIDSVTADDWKTYRCIAKNKFGDDAENIALIGYMKPKAPQILSVTTSGDSAQVEWRFNDDGGMPLQSLTLQYKPSDTDKWKSIQISPPDTITYTINGLEPDKNYNFRVQAANELGSSPPSPIYLAKTAPKDGTSKGMLGGVSTTVLIIGGAAGGFLFLLFVILGVLCSIRRMQKRNDNRTPNGPTTPIDVTEMSAFLPPPPIQNANGQNLDAATANPLSNSRWEFPRDRVKTSVVLGSGAFGVVMKADAQGIKGCVGSLPVAVKIVKENDSDTARRDLMAELDLLKLIDPHPNVIGLLGCCTRGDPLMVIVEFCQYGDLQSYLRHCRGIEDKYYEQIYMVPEKKLTAKDLLSFGIQAARGMAHLASMKVVHRDLAARNILIDEKSVCKVSDFGFARDIYVEDHYTRKTQGGRFPIKWMAIESLLDGVSTTKSDVWSYGVLLWEIVTLGASPYPGMNSQEVINFLQDGYRMDKPKHCLDELYAVMLDCWQLSAQRRPTFVEISRLLNKMLSDEREYISLRMYDDHLYVNFDGQSAGTSLSLNHNSSVPWGNWVAAAE
ncbi:fibroblast growth factor receptor 4 isoform X3 [Nematostella vectensis]|uniref:fibroblast growth factor receptor 4 isoform X3 n=1 Tax=Nematostella vectensis TaxID=45351 RepID=UPI00138FDEE8|nr:fibroblast growth factor receptor 4 isoform X3 [Nematostella vectensis]